MVSFVPCAYCIPRYTFYCLLVVFCKSTICLLGYHFIVMYCCYHFYCFLILPLKHHYFIGYVCSCLSFFQFFVAGLKPFGSHIPQYWYSNCPCTHGSSFPCRRPITERWVTELSLFGSVWSYHKPLQVMTYNFHVQV